MFLPCTFPHAHTHITWYTIVYSTKSTILHSKIPSSDKPLLCWMVNVPFKRLIFHANGNVDTLSSIMWKYLLWSKLCERCHIVSEWSTGTYMKRLYGDNSNGCLCNGSLTSHPSVLHWLFVWMNYTLTPSLSHVVCLGKTFTVHFSSLHLVCPLIVIKHQMGTLMF